jgi:hypothetical protein
MTLTALAVVPTDLSSLALDAALQLDRLSRDVRADLGPIDAFGKQLGSPTKSPAKAGLFCLQENPVNVDILNSALFRTDEPALVNVADLEARLREILTRLHEVAAGRHQDKSVLTALKRFCLSLHTVLLDELTPRVDRDEWMTVQLAH